MTDRRNHRYAVAVAEQDGRRQCTRLDRTALTGLDEAVAAVRGAATSDVSFGFFNADESFFLILRVTPAETALLLSDARAAQRHTLAAQALDATGAAPPGGDAGAALPAGDLDIVSALGLTAAGMAAVLAGPDALPDDQLRVIAERCGFAAEFDRVKT
ncbi:tRNA adenosine deaminase-associated protein [Streptomyces lavendulae]|uniref:tRNA adenosine deaminase-associated protein n=1 Tax=Streptomyces lavendulae TaxID=1914 RepID=UPI0024A541A4|nr:tRNA adenosine deaminase-associated protein [Streptomyces lavendulae]GLX17131.1 tRNA adenosine deaminase [Streptomyces lavendulae subsp. lavendulae]GLX29638.1 tRNA adenosine deaminase [Streptomyces lavendulae subsp. lavendulae]